MATSQTMQGTMPMTGATRRPGRWTALTLGRPRLKRKAVPAFTRQLATLLRAGLPLVRALRSLESQERDQLAARTIAALADDIEGGMSFSDALARQPRTFDRLYINMVRAGEVSGKLDEVLRQLSRHMEKSARLRAKVKSALVYPAVVLTIAGLITMALMIYVVPKFAAMFDEMLGGEPLPALTRAVLAVSDGLVHHAVWILAGLVATGLAVKLLRASTLGRRAMDHVLLRLPPVSTLVVKANVARLCSTLSTLMGAGVSVLGALKIVQDTTANSVMADAVGQVHDAVREGEPMARPFRDSRVFPSMMISMIEVGEETGELPEMLASVADVYEEEVDMAVEALTSLIEPAMIVLLGVTVGGIVLAMFLPLLKLIDVMC